MIDFFINNYLIEKITRYTFISCLIIYHFIHFFFQNTNYYSPKISTRICMKSYNNFIFIPRVGL